MYYLPFHYLEGVFALLATNVASKFVNVRVNTGIWLGTGELIAVGVKLGSYSVAATVAVSIGVVVGKVLIAGIATTVDVLFLAGIKVENTPVCASNLERPKQQKT